MAGNNRFDADRSEIARFVNTMFRHAEPGFVSLRAFPDSKGQGRPIFIEGVAIDGDLEPLVSAATTSATKAGNWRDPTVFSSPVAVFLGPKRATETDLVAGLEVLVECDQDAQWARETLTQILGKPTVTVASGGQSVDPDTGEVEPKLHLHWRLKEPTKTAQNHTKLKRLRELACDLVGADATSKTVVHPIRWPGSWHRKGEPRLVRILELTENELDLDLALRDLESVQPPQGANGHAQVVDDDLLMACAQRIPNAELDWDRWNRIGMTFYAASGGNEAGFTAFERFSAKAAKNDPEETRRRWEHYHRSPPSRLTIGTLIHLAKQADPDFRPHRTKSSGPNDSIGSTPFDISDDGLALGLGRHWQHDMRHVAKWGRWLFWDQSRWRFDESLEYMTRTRDYLRARADSVVPAEAEKLRSAQKVKSVASLARSNRELVADVDQWDQNPWLLNTPEGTIDLRTGQLRAARRTDYCTKSTAVVPAPPGARAPLWEAFLERIFQADPSLIAFVQRIAGYALAGVSIEQVLLFCWGSGANGKSTLLNLLTYLLGDYAAVAPSNLLLVSKAERHPCDQAMLRGARFVTAQEMPPGGSWDESKLKSLTGGDPISARFMRQDFFTFTPQFTLAVGANHKPSFSGVDESIRRRVLLLPFLVTIPKVERDSKLTEKLKAEMPAILRWAIEGCLAWREYGLDPPECVRAASEEYFEAEDVLGQWIEEWCAVDPTITFTATAVLFNNWKQWCEANGQHSWTSRSFGKALSERGFELARTNNSRGFKGIGIRYS